MKHEERHALGLWLVAAFLGGFAVLYWGADLLRRDDAPATPPPVEQADSAGQRGASSSTARRT